MLDRSRSGDLRSFLDRVEATVSPGTVRHRRMVSTVPAAVHGLPETVRTKLDAEERLAKMKKFKSANYDPPETELHRLTELNRSELDYSQEESWRWIIAVLIGVCVGVTAFNVNWAIDALTTLKYSVTTRVIDSAGGFWAPYAVYMAFCLFYATLAASVVSFFEPLAAGSGIPELKTYLNGVQIEGLLTVRAGVCKMVGIMFTISSGLVAGKVGPFVHAGGIIGGRVGQMGSRFFRNEADHRDFVAVGTGTGIACAFGAPIGGLLFTIEESASFYSTSFFWRGFLSTCVGTAVVNILEGFKPSQILSILSNKVGISRDFGPYNLDRGGWVFYFYLWETPAFLLLGMLGGAFGALFIALNVHVLKWRQKNVPATQPLRRVLEVVFICFVTQTVWFLVSFGSRCAALPQAIDETSSTFRYYPRLWCPKGEFKPYATLFFNSLANALRIMCHFDDFQAGVPVTYFFLALIFMTWTFGVGAATGLFITSLVVGAAMGRWYGKLLQSFVSSVAPGFQISLPGYAVVGAASMLSGTTRMTLSISVLVMETTGSLGMIVPIMLGVFMAKIVGDKLGLSVHDTQIKMRGAPVLPESGLKQQQKMVHMKLLARDVMQTKVIHVNPVMRIKDLIDVLRSTEHEIFPVTWHAARSEGGPMLPYELLGVVERHVAVRMLKNRIGFVPIPPGPRLHVDFFDPTYDPRVLESLHSPAMSQELRLQVTEQLAQATADQVRMDDQPAIFGMYPLLEQETTCIDFRPFMNKNPLVVPEDATLFRAYRLFRIMGLRYLFVTPSRPEAVGMITRKDLTEENAQLVLLNMALSRGLVGHDFLENDPEITLTHGLRKVWKDIIERPLSHLPFIDYLEAIATRTRGGKAAARAEAGSGAGLNGSHTAAANGRGEGAAQVEMAATPSIDDTALKLQIESLQYEIRTPPPQIRGANTSRSPSPAPEPRGASAAAGRTGTGATVAAGGAATPTGFGAGGRMPNRPRLPPAPAGMEDAADGGDGGGVGPVVPIALISDIAGLLPDSFQGFGGGHQ